MPRGNAAAPGAKIGYAAGDDGDVTCLAAMQLMIDVMMAMSRNAAADGDATCLAAMQLMMDRFSCIRSRTKFALDRRRPCSGADQ